MHVSEFRYRLVPVAVCCSTHHCVCVSNRIWIGLHISEFRLKRYSSKALISSAGSIFSSVLTVTLLSLAFWINYTIWNLHHKPEEKTSISWIYNLYIFLKPARIWNDLRHDLSTYSFRIKFHHIYMHFLYTIVCHCSFD